MGSAISSKLHFFATGDDSRTTSVMQRHNIPLNTSPQPFQLLLTMVYGRNTSLRDQSPNGHVYLYTTNDGVRALMDDESQYAHSNERPMFVIYHKCFKSAESSRHRLYVVTEINPLDLCRCAEYCAWSRYQDQGPVTEQIKQFMGQRNRDGGWW